MAGATGINASNSAPQPRIERHLEAELLMYVTSFLSFFPLREMFR